jgi:multiple sugar transport system ATP-binding protein
MRTEIKRLHQRVSTTVVYVTHDQVEAMTLADRIVIMRDGLIEQIGTPDEIYNAPVSTYVAGFIGSPTMNLLPAELTGETLRLAQGIELPLPQRHRRHAGQRVTLGIRPEDFQLAPAGEPGIEVTPDVIEPLGSDTLVFFTLEGNEAVARLAPRELGAGRPERLRLKPDLARLHLFSASDGRALSGMPAPASPALAAAGAP